VNAVGYRVAHRLRAERGALVRVALAVAAVAGIVLTITAGAHRTATAPDRYVERASSRFDATVTQDDGPPRTSEIARLAAVDDASGFTFLFAGLVTDGLADLLVFAGDVAAFDLELVEGRQSDPSRPDEVVLTRSAATGAGLTVGDTVTFVSFTQPGFEGEPDGPTLDLTVVGIADGPSDGDPTERAMSFAILPSSILDVGQIANALTLISVKLAPGADLDALRSELDTLDRPGVLSVAPRSPLSDSVRRAVETVARGLWILAAAAAIAAIAAIGQLVARQVRLTRDDRSALSAIGYRSENIRRECLLVGAVSVVAGAVLGVFVAYVASAAFPLGFVRAVEPENGVRFDWVVVPLGALALGVLVIAWVGASLSLPPVTRRGQAGSVRPFGRWLESWPDAATSVGVRFAFWRSDRDAGAVRAAAVGLGATLVAVTGAAVVSSSLDRLVHDPVSFGEFYEMRFDLGQDQVDPDVIAALAADPDVGPITVMAADQARIGNRTIRLVGFDQVQGSLRPPAVDGRLPESEDEVALGRVEAEQLGLGIGDELTVEGAVGSVSYDVVGIAVVPSVGENDGVGQDGLLTMSGLRRIAPDVPAEALVADPTPDAPDGTTERILATMVPLYSGQEVPVVVVNLDRVRFVPIALAGFLLLLALMTAIHAVNTTIRNRRRDFAVLRALGATRHWTRRAVVVHALTFVLAPSVVAVPLGVVAGSVVFRLMADAIGVVNRSSVPVVTLLAGTAAVSLIVAVVALMGSRWINGSRPGALLRSE
jgi:ABC-type lipoprotein release transport system permease subunit